MFTPILNDYRVVSIEEFLSSCLNSSGSQYVFRGQSSDNWNLTPSGFRGEDNILVSSEERNRRIRIFQSEEFISKLSELYEILKKREGIKELDGKSFRRLQLMVVAQHFGVPTPLLDWTQSPLVAAYMAINFKYSPGNIALYRMDISCLPVDVIYENYSRVSFNRINSQFGGVSCFGNLSGDNFQLSPDTFEEYFLTNKLKIESGKAECFVSKVSIKYDNNTDDYLKDILRCNGINTENLFPDSGHWKAHSIKEYLRISEA